MHFFMGMIEEDSPAPLESAAEEGEVRRRKRLIDWIWPRGPLWLRILRLVFVILLLPYALILLYWVPFVHPVSTLMLSDLVLLKGYDRRWIEIGKIAPVLVKSVMMSEDGQFCAHYGVDTVQLKGVIEDAMEGHATRGASTIPMQTVKNLYLFNGRSFIRKGLELPLAFATDFVWSKERIMEVYLNIAEWGPGIYGIEAAAQTYFKVPASKLSAGQAALLAAALPNPYVRIPNKPSRGMKAIAGLIARRAAASGDYVRCIYP
jgi:monofunctional biosynthetic peptidoglycan transglycosylase